ncbi:MAG: AAA family ATPase, partial [Candidatus Omnitrophica bacterium]|nr:AAA family ATPase [Candidatus Omnitrophota bacterium]
MTDQPSLFGDSFQPDREPPKPKKVSGEASHVSVPLAERMRPRSLDEFLGQEKVIGPDTLLRKAVEKGAIPSLILWGPPASGKTTLALLLSKHTQARFVTLSAVTSGVKDIREAVENARQIRDHSGTGTVLFIDEIHRFNKSQQDALLPHVEKGLFTLIGATTENPSFEVNGALLSRVRVLVLEPLAVPDLVSLLRHALESERGFGGSHSASDAALQRIAHASDGDARRALVALETAAAIVEAGGEIRPEDVAEALQRKLALYDKSGEEHYNL